MPSTPPLIDTVLATAVRLSAVAGLPDTTDPPDSSVDSTAAQLRWLNTLLQRTYDHLITDQSNPPTSLPRHPSPSTTAFARCLQQRLSATVQSMNSDDVDLLDGVEDVRVDSEDDMPEGLDITIPRRSSASTRRTRRPSHQMRTTTQRITHPIVPDPSNISERRPSQNSIPPYAPSLPSRGSAYSASLPFLPELPLDDDTVAGSNRTSQAHMDHRPQIKLPLGSPANSYLTHMSSFKSLGQGEATRLHRDYSKIFNDSKDEDSADRRPGESSIEIAGGDLYTKEPLAKRWNVARKIGEGGYSTVRVATRKVKGRRTSPSERNVAAVKIISKRSHELYNERMVSREVFSFRLLDMAGGHANIVELYEVCEDSDNVYIVMELLEGGELFARIAERGQYTERDAATLVVSMLSSLSFCHRLNLTHRDVKPENFVFASQNSDGADVKLTDFGIAHYSEDPHAMCKTLCGTPLYVAPEVLLRQPYGPEADLWSLGVIVYIMLVGYPPFDDNDLVQLVKKIKYRPAKFDGPEWMLISEEAKQFLSNLLDKDSSTRMTAQQALQHEWLKDNCQAATDNVLSKAQTNIKSFVSRKRWKAAIQGVKAMNRMHKMVELARQGHIIDDPDDISAEQVEVVNVQRPGNGQSKSPPNDQRRYSTSSSSSSEPAFLEDMRRRAPVRTRPAIRSGEIDDVGSGTSVLMEDATDGEDGIGATSGRGSSAIINVASMATVRSAGSAASGATTSSVRRTRRLGRLSLTLRRRASSALTGDGMSGGGVKVMKENASNSAFLAIDSALESSDDSRQLSKDWREVRRRRGMAVDRGRSSLSGMRGEAGQFIGANGSVDRARREIASVIGGSGGDSDSGRVERTMTRGDAGVVRKMSSHARRIVGKGKRRVLGVSLDESLRGGPAVVEMGEHRKQKKFPWFR